MSNYRDVSDYVENFDSKHKQGLIRSEVAIVLEHFNKTHTLNMDKYYDAMYCNTCMVIDEEIINYHCDIIQGIVCAIENRELTSGEWD